MRGVFVALILFCSAASAGDIPAYQVPLYGGLPTTDSYIAEEHQRLLDVIQKAGVGPAEASDKAVVAGWASLKSKDFSAAMMRFNHAWLLDPNNGDAFDGFAVTVYQRDKDEALAEALFQEAVKSPRRSASVFADYGQLLVLEKRYDEAVNEFQAALAMPGANESARAMLAVTYLQEHKYRQACRELHKLKGQFDSSYDAAITAVKAACIDNGVDGGVGDN